LNSSLAKEYILILDKFLPAIIRHFQVGNPREIYGINITIQQYITLRAISTRGKCTANELSALLGVTAGTMSVMLNRLSVNHYIKRERDRSDRRIVYITPTPEAEKTIDKIISVQAEHSISILGKLNERDRQDLMRIMQNLFSITESLETNGKGK
jgi:DNA-binding MarR family transcriptional regulator